MNYQKEILRKQSHLQLHQKIKYLTKEVNDLYSENYKALMKETEDDTNKRKGTPCSWTEELILLK